jgi:hypothetical protein
LPEKRKNDSFSFISKESFSPFFVVWIKHRLHKGETGWLSIRK